MTTQAVRCDTCGADHPTGAGHVRRRGHTLCPSCVGLTQHRKKADQGLLLWLLFAATVVSWLIDTPNAIRYPLTSTSLIFVGAALITVVHEGGHAAAATLMGIRVRQVNIGVAGPVVASYTRGTFAVRFFLLPLAGSTALEPATRAFRTKHVIATAAGPLTAIALMAGFYVWQPASWAAAEFRDVVLLMSGFSLVANLLVPLPWLGNDAWSLWKIVTMGDQDVDLLGSIGEHDAVIRRLHDHITGDPLEPEQLEEIRRFFLERLERPGMDGPSRALKSSNLASVDLMTGRADLLEEADRLSTHAYETLAIPEIAAGRGSVLLAMGRDAEAVPLLERALPHLEGANADSIAAGLALAAVRGGDVFTARRYLGSIDDDLNTWAYREAHQVLGPVELRNLVSTYWSDGRSPTQVADMVRADAGAAAQLIARTVAEFVDIASDEELAALMTESSGTSVEAAKARGQLESLIEALTRRAA